MNNEPTMPIARHSGRNGMCFASGGRIKQATTLATLPPVPAKPTHCIEAWKSLPRPPSTLVRVKDADGSTNIASAISTSRCGITVENHPPSAFAVKPGTPEASRHPAVPRSRLSSATGTRTAVMMTPAMA